MTPASDSNCRLVWLNVMTKLANQGPQEGTTVMRSTGRKLELEQDMSFSRGAPSRFHL